MRTRRSKHHWTDAMTAEETKGHGQERRHRRLEERFVHSSAGAHGCISGERGSRTARRNDGVGSARLAVDQRGLGLCPWYNRHNTPSSLPPRFAGPCTHDRNCKYSGSASCHRRCFQKERFRHEAKLLSALRRTLTGAKMTRHKTSALIFDEPRMQTVY